MLALILNKVEGTNKVIKELKSDFSLLNKTMTSHLASIKQLETQLGNISAHLNQRQKGDLPTNTVVNPKNDPSQCMTITSRCGDVLGDEKP